MLDCHACLLRCLRAIAQEAPPVSSHARRRTASYATSQLQQPLRGRSYATTVARRPSESFQAEAIRAAGKTPWKESEQYKKQNKKAVAETRREPGANAGGRRSNVHRELEWLEDPAKLADHVRYTLRTEDENKARELITMASKRMQCTVSWNHLIDYLMGKQKINEAIKTYNDMKKRAQTPDSHTYLLLLRGLANNAHIGQALGKALSIYHSMSAPNSKVPPSIIHTNAVLKVCARANDMDALWGIASRIPEHGPSAADSTTFTTIFNAIRQNTLVDKPEGESEDQTARRREQAILEGRRIWDDVVGRWRKGDLFIDEGLVCAMGRLLLIGSRPRDWDDILSLIEQTMNIPRLVPRLGTKARLDTHIPRIRAPHTPEDMKREDDIEPGESQRGDEFLPVAPSKSVGRGRNKDSSSLAYANPGPNTLSLILEACLKTIAKKPASDYWALLTDSNSHGIPPDSDNLHMFLRILRQARASGEAVDVLRHGFRAGGGVQPLPKTFRIAMSACVRNKNGPDAMVHAGQVLEFMANRLPHPDIKTLAMYAELALEGPSAADVARALERLGPSVLNLKTLIGNGRDHEAGLKVTAEEREDALAVVRRLVGCYDRLLNSGEAPADKRDEYEGQKRKLSAFVTRQKDRAVRAESEGVDSGGRRPLVRKKLTEEQRRSLRKGERVKRVDRRREAVRVKATKERAGRTAGADE